ncbi:MAG TPA: Hsp20/alpha crystallin family protein [Candidatus Binataceae bacterium]|nr:Hsp20/alpha crystallin family protein [Candidatus Binataceae bacterium]
MALMERWNPSRELEKFRHDFDDLLERLGFEHGRLMEWEPISRHPAIESYVDGDKFIVRLDVPGIDPKDIDIKVAGDVLTVKGSREEKRETEKPHYFQREVRYGSFERSISLPAGIKAEDLKAIFSHGVLELSAPMPKEAAPKAIKVQIERAETKKPAGGKKAPQE